MKKWYIEMILLKDILKDMGFLGSRPVLLNFLVKDPKKSWTRAHLSMGLLCNRKQGYYFGRPWKKKSQKENISPKGIC